MPDQDVLERVLCLEGGLLHVVGTGLAHVAPRAHGAARILKGDLYWRRGQPPTQLNWILPSFFLAIFSSFFLVASDLALVLVFVPWFLAFWSYESG